MARTLLPLDEINRFEVFLAELHESGRLKTERGKGECVDALLELLIMSYVLGNDAVNEMFGTNNEVSLDEMQRTIYRDVDGKNFADRVYEYADKETAVSDIKRVAETEAHHSYDSSANNTARKVGATVKIWRTMMDDKVRDQHDYLHGSSVGIDDDFYTYTGAHAPFPGAFNDAENDVNCRCWVEYK